MDQMFHFLIGRGHRMDMKFVFPRHPVNLRYRFILFQCLRRLRKGLRRKLQFKIAGHRAADLLRIDDRCVFLDHTSLLQRLDPGFHRYSGDPDFLADLRVRHAGVLDQKPDNFLVQFIQSFQKHICHLTLSFFPSKSFWLCLHFTRRPPGAQPIPLFRITILWMPAVSMLLFDLRWKCAGLAEL